MSRKANETSTTRLFRLAAVAPAIAAASLFTAALAVGSTMQRAEDSAAIGARIEEYRRVWDTHDPAALAAFFTEDADFVMGNLPAEQGRERIRVWWRNYFARQEPERRLILEVSPVRFVAADVAVVNVETTTGGHDRESRELLARRFRGTWLLHRENDTWFISAMRGLPKEEDRVVLNASFEAAETLKPQIRAFVGAYEDALNTHDPAAVSGFYSSDAEIIVRNSPAVQGRPAIRNWWQTYFSQPQPYRAILIIDEIRMISPEVALINLTATSAVKQSEDQRLPASYARATWVIVQDAGEWLISALWTLPGLDDDIVRLSSGSN